MGQVVVGVDGSEGAADALRWALDEASLHGWSVTAVMAWGYLAQRHADGQEFVPGYDEPDAADALEHFVSDAAGARADQVDRQLRNDLAVPAMLDAADGADLLVLGARGLGGFRGLLLGSVSQRCLQAATCPTVIIREDTRPERSGPARIVVAVDRSAGAAAALAWALDEARVRGARVEAVHAWAVPYFGAPPYAVDLDPAPFEDAARNEVEAAVAAADTSGLAEPVKCTTVVGNATQVVLDAAQDADLLVVGTRGVGAVRAMLLGSTSQQIAHHATCPVVVVPDTES